MMFPFITRESFLWWKCQQVDTRCQTTNQLQLCGSLTRVSWLDFCVSWSSWSSIHYLHKYTTTLTFRNCASVKTWSTYGNWSASRFPFCLGLDVRYLSGSSRQFPAAGLVFADLYCSMNVTLLSPHPIISMQIVRPYSIQHPIIASHESRAIKPSIRSPASNEMISDSVELWCAGARILHIQLMETMFGFQRNTRFPTSEFDFWIFKVSSKICHEIIPIVNAEPCYSHDYVVGSHWCDECMKLILSNVWHQIVSIWRLI